MKQAHSLLRLSFSHAVQTGVLTTNPLRDLKPPASRSTPPRAYPAPTWAIMAALVRVLTDRRSILKVLLLMWAGLRYSDWPHSIGTMSTPTSPCFMFGTTTPATRSSRRT